MFSGSQRNKPEREGHLFLHHSCKEVTKEEWKVTTLFTSGRRAREGSFMKAEQGSPLTPFMPTQWYSNEWDGAQQDFC